MPSTGPFADPHGSIQIECMPFTSNSNFGAKASRALIFLQPMASQLVFPVKKHVIRNTGTSFHHAGTSAAIPADSTILPNISAACFMPLPTFVSSSTLSSSVVQNNGHRRQEISLLGASCLSKTGSPILPAIWSSCIGFLVFQGPKQAARTGVFP